MDRIKKLKVLLGLVKSQFSEAKLLDGSVISFDALEINREVYDAEGNSLKAGEYVLEDGTKITVDENGVIKEIQNPATDEVTKEEVVSEKMTESKADESKADEGNGEEGETEDGGKKADEGGEAVVIKVEGVGEITLANDGKVYYNADGKVIEGDYTDVDGKYVVVIKGGKVVDWKVIEQPAQPDTQTTPEVVYVMNEDDKKYKVPLKEGATVRLKDGDYTDLEGEYIVTVKGGQVSGWRNAKAPEAPTTDGELVEKRQLEDRVKDLENKVDEIYNLILQLNEKEMEKEERITEIKEEFAAIKSNPSAQPVFFSKTEERPISKIEKLKRLKNQ